MLQVVKVISGSEPITLEEAKDWLRVDGDTDDTLITTLITQARELVENYLNISIIDTTITLTASARKELLLPYGPVQTISSVKDTDGNDLEYTYNGFYITFGTGTISVTGGNTYYVESVTTYDAGVVSPVPGGLQLGLLETISYLYENRGDEADIKIPMFLYQNQNLQPYRSNNVWI